MIRLTCLNRWIGIGLPLVLFLFSGTALAAETSGNWRPTYDLVMKWVNFFILVFIIVKYARRPLKNFLADRKEDLQKEIQHLEEEKAGIADQVSRAMKSLEDSAETLAALKARILREGEAERERLIREAQVQARLMLDGSARKVENQLRRAKDAMVAEIVDAAVALALQKLPEMITPEDQQRWIDRFTASAHR